MRARVENLCSKTPGEPPFKGPEVVGFLPNAGFPRLQADKSSVEYPEERRPKHGEKEKFVMASPNMNDYAEVPERIVAFHVKYPNGSLQSEYDVVDLPNKDGKVTPHIIVKAYAYRTPEDPKPGQGLASEPVPGFTPYTKGSEMMNAETSAWGRALVSIGFMSSKKIASAEEVRNRQTTDEKPAAPATLTNAQAERLVKKLGDMSVSLDESFLRLQSYGVETHAELTAAQAKDMLAFFTAKKESK